MTLDYIHKAGIQTTPKLERELEQGAKAEKHGFKLQQHAEKSKTIR